MKTQHEAIYNARELGTGKTLILGLQHMFAMFGATVLVPIITGLSISATLLFAVGGVMFPISDSILSAYSFGPDKHFGLNIGVHATYYLAQICIAWSLAFV